MGSITRLVVGTIALVMGSLLAACSGSSGSPSFGSSSTNPEQPSVVRHLIDASGHRIKGSGEGHLNARLGRDLYATSRRRADRGNVYVSDVRGDVAELENHLYKSIGTITNGISTPDGEWTDANKNLYVTNWRDGSVVEYACEKNGCGSSPTFSYSGTSNPVNVTTDRSGNVFVADYENKVVSEYAQGSNTVIAQCSFPSSAGVTGVAVDSSTEDVFIAYDSATSISAYIEEFAGGLGSCSGTVLAVPIDFTGDLIVDNQKNIIVCDQWNAVVDVIAPPYSSVTSTIGSGWIDPYQPALEKHGKKMLLYIEDSSAGASSYGLIGVFDYPSGAHVTTLNGSNSGPFQNPYGVTDTFNYVP